MGKEPLFISVANQKGGAGKTTYTILLASYLCYRKGYNVLVVDSDFPQGSFFKLRQRELSLLDQSQWHKVQLVKQFTQCGKNAYPILSTQPECAVTIASEFLKHDPRQFDLVFYDLPGTLNTTGVFYTLSTLDYLFVPMKADCIVMESTITYAKIIQEQLIRPGKTNLKGIFLFWTLIDGRERTELYTQYEKVLDALGLQKLSTRIPARSKFSKKLQAGINAVCRSTILAPDTAFTADCRLDALADEILSLLNLDGPCREK